jgi:hypothetical protein
MDSLSVLHVTEEFVNSTVGKRVAALKSSNLICEILPFLEPSREEMQGVVTRANPKVFVLETDKGKVKCLWGQFLRFVE